MLHPFQNLRTVARAHLHELPVNKQKRDYLIGVERIKDLEILFPELLQRLEIPVSSFARDELDVITFVVCACKAKSRYVQVFFVMVRACSLDKTCPAAKVVQRINYSPALRRAEWAKAGTHEEHQRLATLPFQRFVGNMHKLAKYLFWNEVSHGEFLLIILLMF